MNVKGELLKSGTSDSRFSWFAVGDYKTRANEVGGMPADVEDDIKMYYYRGLKEWTYERGYLRDTCLAAQDKYKAYLDYLP